MTDEACTECLCLVRRAVSGESHPEQSRCSNPVESNQLAALSRPCSSQRVAGNTSCSQGAMARCLPLSLPAAMLFTETRTALRRPETAAGEETRRFALEPLPPTQNTRRARSAGSKSPQRESSGAPSTLAESSLGGGRVSGCRCLPTSLLN